MKLYSSEGWSSEKTVGFLKGGQEFRNFTMSLQAGDKVWFSGRLTEPFSNEPKVSLMQAACLSCEPSDSRPPEPSPLIPAPFKPLFNFLFNPLAIFR